MKTYVIAEAGVNHNGSFELAKKLCDKAKEAGADCVKFQTFIAEKLVSKNAKKADYQVTNTKNNDSQLSMLKKLELSFSQFEELKAYCDKIGIDFISTPFDFCSMDFLAKIGMKFFKVPSGEVTNLPYLEKVASYGIPVVLSTGMCNLEEVENAVRVLKQNGAGDITVLHCTTEYPAPVNEVNLRAIKTLGEKLSLPVGYSDHTEGITVPVAAVALGATVIEKHFTLDKNMEGPDHKASLEPDELKEMVSSIRKVEAALGDGVKKPAASEEKNRDVARRSIVAATDIKKGEKFTEENLTVKRPGNGISPMLWHEIIGKVSDRDYKEDELIEK